MGHPAHRCYAVANPETVVNRPVGIGALFIGPEVRDSWTIRRLFGANVPLTGCSVGVVVIFRLWGDQTRFRRQSSRFRRTVFVRASRTGVGLAARTAPTGDCEENGEKQVWDRVSTIESCHNANNNRLVIEPRLRSVYRVIILG